MKNNANGPVPTPMFPTPSDWKLPKEFPNLSSASRIGLDTETHDPQLKEKGPGVRRGGSVCGISVAVPEGQSWYFPFGHSTGDQFEKEKVLAWAKDNLCRPNQPKVGANLLYDLDYLAELGINVQGPFYDIQVAEPLIDENKLTYSLDSLAKQYLGEQKNEVLLRQACNDFKLGGKPQQHIWRLDPKYTGYYAESDALQSLQIFEMQEKIIQRDDLEYIFDIETRLIPMLLHMRRNGVPVDTKRILELHDSLSQKLQASKKKLNSLARTEVDFWAAESIARVFDKMDMPYPMTPKTKKPSFVKGWLEKHEHPISKLIVECREYDKLIGTFVEGSLLNMMVGDRIHCLFNQLKSDDSGAVTGRFSSSKPNLQFIPTRTDLGKLIRKCFIPDVDHSWIKQDYSQIEIRVLVHYAMGQGAKEVVAEFNRKPKTDYHQWCASVADITRSQAKTINFGLVYGMGADKLSVSLKISPKEAKDFINIYFSKLPFVKKTVKTATDIASARGYVKTIMGRRRRFPLFEPRDSRVPIKPSRDSKTLEEKVSAWIDSQGGRYYRGVGRAGCYKAFNAADQGSSADIMKKSMVEVWESGVCDVVKMYLTVHDELDYGMPRTKEGIEAVKHIGSIMENTVKLKIPLIADTEIGDNWGEVKEWDPKEVYGKLLTGI